MKKLNPKALALGIGSICGFYIFCLGIVAMFGWGAKAVEAISSVYIGYAPTLIGAITGGIWGLIDGVIAGLVIAYIYNYFAKKK